SMRNSLTPSTGISICALAAGLNSRSRPAKSAVNRVSRSAYKWLRLSQITRPSRRSPPGPLPLPLQRLAVPIPQLRGGGVGLLQESEQEPVGIVRALHGVVGQDELPEPGVIEGLGAGETRLAVALRLRVGVDEERCAALTARAGPEAAARALVRIGLGDHPGGDVGRAPFRRRRRAAGEARHRQVEAAPEEMHRAHLA